MTKCLYTETRKTKLWSISQISDVIWLWMGYGHNFKQLQLNEVHSTNRSIPKNPINQIQLRYEP